MHPFIRISTSPPNEWPGVPGEASHYCDLRQLEGWRSSRSLSLMPQVAREEALRAAVACYEVVGTYANRVFGLLVCVADEAEGLMFLGVDNEGRTRREPAANEALWDVANAAMGPDDDSLGARAKTVDDPTA